jgi:hypothetical protein
MSRWHDMLAEMRASRLDVQNVQNVQNDAWQPTFERFERFERPHKGVDVSMSPRSAELLAPLFATDPAFTDEPPVGVPCAARRGRIVGQPGDGAFSHFCVECGAWGSYGFDVSLRAGKLGRWYCRDHRPHRSGAR